MAAIEVEREDEPCPWCGTESEHVSGRVFDCPRHDRWVKSPEDDDVDRLPAKPASGAQAHIYDYRRA